MDTLGNTGLRSPGCSPGGGKGRVAWPLLGMVTTLLILALAGPRRARAADVPVVKGDLGPCTADFAVTDDSNKPLYDAKIQVTIFYGFMNKKQSNLEVGTNGDGKARFEGLPQKVKKPLEFKVNYGRATKSVPHNPWVNCQASFTVALSSQ